MTLSTHTAIGAVIGFNIGQPAIGFVLGFISHFMVDMIPHGDSDMAHQLKVKKMNIKRIIAYGTVDAISAIILIMVLFNAPITVSGIALGAAIAGSILPDLLVGIYDLTKTKYLAWFNRLHFFFHDFFVIKYRDVKLTYSLLGQMMFIVVIFRIL